MVADSSNAKTVWVYQDPDVYNWHIFQTKDKPLSYPTAEALVVGEATLASWLHAEGAFYRAQVEIEDMVNAKREAERSV